MNTDKTPRPFEIGLVMAGAVSAGAYTAGVMDYLLEVIETWQDAKNKGESVPGHQVKIRVMTGSSAGGMTTAITAVELLKRANDPSIVKEKGYKSLMYQAWVKEIDITKLLETEDLKESGPIKSMLDSTVIDRIANKIINADKPLPWKPLPYIDHELKVYITLSNLRGLPYEFKIEGETGFPYGMTDHSDYQYVEIKEGMKKADWVKLRNAAVATGAFPIGLASRLIERDMDEYKTRMNKDGREISGLMKVESEGNRPYNFVAVDGGTLNNEPIELARSVWERLTEDEKKEINSVDDLHVIRRAMRLKAMECLYAIIMVDPFPDLADIGKNPAEDDTGLLNILGPLIGALRSQSLFKIEELLRAGEKDKNDRFLVAPIRYTESDKLAKNAIACGFFGGFGGFLSEAFRKHDYELGRRNCQRFLQKYFRVTRKTAEESGWDLVPDYLFSDNGNSYYPVIPVIKGTEVSKEQGAGNNWPCYSSEEASILYNHLKVRVHGLLGKALPFGWIGQSWATVVMIMILILVVAGEFIKSAIDPADQLIFIRGISNTYILVFQVVLLLVFFFLMVLRVGKMSIAKRLVNLAHKTMLTQMREWGIRSESK